MPIFTQLTKDEAEKFRQRVEYEDTVLNARTNIILTLNGLAAVAAGLSIPPHARLGVAIIMILIDSFWIPCAAEAAAFIGELTNRLRESKDVAPPDEAFRFGFASKRVHIGPTKFFGGFMPWLLLAGWILAVFAVLYAALASY